MRPSLEVEILFSKWELKSSLIPHVTTTITQLLEKIVEGSMFKVLLQMFLKLNLP